MSLTSDDTGRIIEALKSLGLTKYEGLAYIGLLRCEGATATEVHEVSGVPRASVYPALDKLVQKGLVAISNSVPKRFEALAPKEGIVKLKENIELNADFAEKELEKIYNRVIYTGREKQELVWSISGYENIVDKFRSAIASADLRIQLIAEWSFLREHLLPTLLEKQGRIDIEIITDRWEGIVPEGAWIRVVEDEIREFLEPRREMSGMCIIDSRVALVIMSSPGREPSAMFSESSGFLNFFMNYWKFISFHAERKHCIKAYKPR